MEREWGKGEWTDGMVVRAGVVIGGDNWWWSCGEDDDVDGDLW